MKKYELIKINKDLQKVMSDNDIKVSDVSFIEVYDDFVEKSNILKFSVAIIEIFVVIQSKSTI